MLISGLEEIIEDLESAKTSIIFAQETIRSATSYEIKDIFANEFMEITELLDNMKDCL